MSKWYLPFKICTECKEEKPRSAYPIRVSGPRAGHLRSSKCKSCEKRPEIRRVIVLEALASGCADCGTTDLIVLNFDHRDPATKLYNISTLLSARNKFSVQILRDEISKCDVVCSNCHIHRTAKKFGNWRLEVIRKKKSENPAWSPEQGSP
jgi:hypothetical protein